jgi:hypothetical protein
MFQKMVENLIRNLPIDADNSVQSMDLVLEGGAFNGSYMLGILYFLKHLEERKRIKIKRISGVSIGALLGLIYQLGCLDFAVSFYKSVYKHLKKNKDLTIVHTFCQEITPFLTEDFYLKASKRFFVTYYDFKKGKKVVKSTYKSNQDLLDTIIRSSYLSFICGPSCFYKNRYTDGIFPYLFPKLKNPGTKVLYINLSNYDKILGMFIIKNEKNNVLRILTGIVDAYSFFEKKEKTMMCSYLEKWSYFDQIGYILKRLLETLFFWNMWLYFLLERYVLDEMSHTFFHQLFYRLLHHFNKSMIEWYCV